VFDNVFIVGRPINLTNFIRINSNNDSYQCSKGFLPRLFFTFCLGSGTEAYWGETKRYTFWPRLSPEAIDPVLCLGCFEIGAIYTTFCIGSIRTEAISDKYFSYVPVPYPPQDFYRTTSTPESSMSPGLEIFPITSNYQCGSSNYSHKSSRWV